MPGSQRLSFFPVSFGCLGAGENMSGAALLGKKRAGVVLAKRGRRVEV